MAGIQIHGQTGKACIVMTKSKRSPFFCWHHIYHNHSFSMCQSCGLHKEGSEHPLGQQLSVQAGTVSTAQGSSEGLLCKVRMGRSLDTKLINSLKSSKV